MYGFFAITIAKLFFPTADETVSLLLTLGTFAVSYLIRPLGAAVLGSYADRVGRKAAMLNSIWLMMLGTFLIAVMPTYSTIGLLAPLGIFLARLIQGFSAGGEFGSATALLVEQAPERKGVILSFMFASQGVSGLLGSGFGLLLTKAKRLQVIALAAFEDNYIWLLADPQSRLCAVVDPGDATPLADWLRRHPDWPLTDILITHHHSDHVGGAAALKHCYGARVLGPATEPILCIDYLHQSRRLESKPPR
ncbi:MFS transporter [Pseudomonas fildesensis]|uniref:MFS transporter n=1 Tax=Pseudomonas fildesensis TaxID=1674920 RepID=UPI0022A9E29A|nr:MFS transporter [Pseudomonas fildesensis]